MRFASLVLAALLLPVSASAQSLGSPSSTTAPPYRTGGWRSNTATAQERHTPPRGGYVPERIGTPPADVAYQREAAKVRRDIRKAERSGQISRKEARSLRRETGSVQGFASRSASGGSLSYAAGSASQNRLEMVRSRLIAARTNGLGKTQPR